MPGTIILLLSVVFALAAISKLRSRDTFRSALQKLLPESVAAPASLFVPLLELFLALFLISGIAPHIALASAIILLLIFSFVLAQMHRRGLKGCGCFGESENTASHRSGIVRNLILIAAASWTMTQTGPISVLGPDASSFIARMTLVIGVLCLWPCLVGLGQRWKFILT